MPWIRTEGPVAPNPSAEDLGIRKTGEANMNPIEKTICEIVGTCPPDLASFYEDKGFMGLGEQEIGMLDLAEARQYSEDLAGIPVVKRLGMWALNNANDSNPFGYITTGPCAGCILYLSHDPEPEFRFPSLASFLGSLDIGVDPYDLRADKPWSVELNNEITALLKEDSQESQFLIVTYLPCASELNENNLNALQSHSDFFLREALARFLCVRGKATQLELAETLAKDSVGQVAGAGARAVDAIKKRKHLAT